MNRRLIILLFPFILAALVLAALFIPQTNAAAPDTTLAEMPVTFPFGAAAINLNNNVFQPARLTNQNQGVFGPNCTTTLGDPFSPISSTLRPPGYYTNPSYPPQYFTYRYRIDIPDNYETATGISTVRVELFDPDSYNHSPGGVEIDTTVYTITHTQPYGGPSTTTGQCSSSDQWRREPCVISTGEPDTYNPGWFIRIDEIRSGNGATCGTPASYAAGNRTQTAFDLYYHRVNSGSGTLEPVTIATYMGREDNLHDTDMRWVSPGGNPSHDQSVFVPVTSGAGTFEVNLNAINDIEPDPVTGLRSLYLDVTTLTGASENGFDVWAGPPTHAGPANPGNPCQGGVPSQVNQRNVHITNCGNTSHRSGGVSIAALDYQPINYNTVNPTARKLVYVGPEYAGETLHVSLFDSDAGAQSPVVFYFDTLAFHLLNPVPAPPANPVNVNLTDWAMPFGVNNTTTADPDLEPGEVRNCRPGNCNNQWVTPAYRIQVPTMDPALCVNPATTPQYCTPFYGGWLMVRYLPGYHDTSAWHVDLPEPPQVDTTASCPGVFPITLHDSVRSVTATGYNTALNTPENERYPAVLPTYGNLLAQGHSPLQTLDQANPGNIFLLVGEGFDLDGYDLLQWNTDTTCPGCTTPHTRLQQSLTWPGNVLDPDLGFHDAAEWSDTTLQVGDRVADSAAEGNAASFQLATHIDRGRTLQFVIYNEKGVLQMPGGSVVDFSRVYQLANFRVLAYRLTGAVEERWLLLQFVGHENSCGQPGASVGFAESSYEVNEADGNVMVTVELSEAITQTVTVSYTTSDGTAAAGQDYAAATGLLTFPPGTISQTIPIPILDDTSLEGSETFSVTLANPDNAALFGTNPVTVTIQDNEDLAEIGFAAATLTVPENSGPTQVVIQQNQAHTSPLQVTITSSDGTATGGDDYTVISDVISFNGAAAYTLTLPILDDTLAEGHETFLITLSDPVNGTVIGSNPLTVLILDNECAFGPLAGPGRLEAEDFDCGGEGTAYHDTTNGNSGTSDYRLGEDVDVWDSAAASQHHYVGNTAAGEWLAYTIVVTETGRYDLRLTAAALILSEVRIEIDGVDVSGPVMIAATGGNEVFVEIAAALDIYLSAGTYQIRIQILSGSPNLDYLTLTAAPTPPVYLPLLLKP